MLRRMFPAAVAALVLFIPSVSAADTPFSAFVDKYYAALFAWDPTQATAAGIHDYDATLPDLSAVSIAKRAERLREMQTELTALRAGSLAPADAIDATLLDQAIKAELHEYDVVKDWKRNPMVYVAPPASAIDLLMKRSFAPAPDRLKSVIGRLKSAPKLIEAMKANVANPPKEFTDLGIIIAKGSVGFFKVDLPAWAKTAAKGDEKLLAEFEAANKPVIDAFEAAAKWLETDLLPKAKGSYALGAEGFLKKLAAEEMVELPLDKLLAMGEANLKKDKDAFVAVAKSIDPTLKPAEVLAKITNDFPQADDLVPATRGTIERTRQFLIDKKIVTVPSEVRPTITETPPFMRTGGFASMDTPGAYETKATEAFYYVTPPEKNWETRRQVEHLKQFNPIQMDIITVHEAFPGHYIQFLFAKQYPTKVRKLYTCGTNVEGWAHYCEQMVVDEGFGNGNPKVRLAQLSEALLRDCRYVVGIKLHTEGWTVEEGKKYYMEQGFIEGEIAFQESRRGTYNPTYLYYTLGKLQILQLREDYKKEKGANFTLQKFHDEFVKQGGIPVPLIRKIMLPE